MFLVNMNRQEDKISLSYFITVTLAVCFLLKIILKKVSFVYHTIIIVEDHWPYYADAKSRIPMTQI